MNLKKMMKISKSIFFTKNYKILRKNRKIQKNYQFLESHKMANFVRITMVSISNNI